MSRIVEKQVVELYTQHNILDINELAPQTIAERLGIFYTKYDGSSEALIYEGKQYILLNDQLSKTDEWFQFCHELGHLQMHCGNQSLLRLQEAHHDFISYQEVKVNNFALHAAAPTHILDACEVYMMDIFRACQFLREKCHLSEYNARRRFDKYMRLKCADNGKMLVEGGGLHGII